LESDAIQLSGISVKWYAKIFFGATKLFKYLGYFVPFGARM